VVTVTLRSDSVEGLNSFLLLLQGLVAVAAFPAANLHSSEGALDSADFCDCLLCFRGCIGLRREKAHFGSGAVSLRRGGEQVMIGSFLTLWSRKVRILGLLILCFCQTVVFFGSREALFGSSGDGKKAVPYSQGSHSNIDN
jgi:hypothetical protein